MSDLNNLYLRNLINQRNLNIDQQRLISMYINQYNQTNTHIEILLDMLDEIKGNIITVLNMRHPRRTRLSRNNRNLNMNSNTNTNINSHLRNNTVSYDYNNPINPSLYYENELVNLLFSNGVNREPRNTSAATNASHLNTLLNEFLNTNIIIRPTDEQIQQACRHIRYGDIENPLSECCPISLEPFDEDDNVRQILHCSHIFNNNQLQEWFQTNVRCPVCRYDIRNYNCVEQTNDLRENNNTEQTNSREQTNRTQINIDNNPNISNINILRDPSTNETETITFDITDSEISGSIINQLTRNLFQTLLQANSSSNANDRFAYDSSNNILLFETYIRANRDNNIQ